MHVWFVCVPYFIVFSPLKKSATLFRYLENNSTIKINNNFHEGEVPSQ